MTKTANGITSSVKAGDKTFILQTEFKVVAENKKPSTSLSETRGKIVTTVAMNGQVVHKVDKPYHEPLSSEEDFINAEKAVKDQHLSVARKVASKPKEFLSAVTEINITPEDKLGLIKGIATVNKIDFGNSADKQVISGSHNPFIEHMTLLRALVVQISQNTRMGRLQRMVGSMGDDKFLLTGFGGETYFLSLRDDADVAAVLNELDSIKTQ